MALLLQGDVQPMLRFGSLSVLETSDVGQLRDLSAQQGRGEPWLLWSGMRGLGPSNGRMRWEVTVLLPPNWMTPSLRRGIAFVAGGSWGQDESRLWSVQPHGPHAWAQVTLPGREPNDIRDTRDANFPFATDNVVSDDELVRVVRFLRSAAIFAKEQDYPIVEVSRITTRNDRVLLKLRNGTAVERYELLPAGDGFAVTWRGVEPQE